MAKLRYVLISPARNEKEHIAKTIRSVLSQTIPPLRWVIVSDASTDGTDEIVRELASGVEWIELLRMPERRERSFAAKVDCFNAGLERVKDLNFDLIGNLDADVSFDPDQYEMLIAKFEECPELGVAGPRMIEERYDPTRDSNVSEKHVHGPCQIFRRKCFADIGGYKKIRGGGVDWTAVTTARMKGWKTQTFGEKTFFHHRPLGTAGGNAFRARFKYGVKDYYLGNHPLWEIFRTGFQIAKKPLVLGGLLILFGYFWGMVTRAERPIPEELVRFHRKEQMQRLAGIFRKLVPGARRKK